MKAISVFEHEDIQESLSDREKETLNKLRGPHGEKMFDVGWNKVRATSFVGVIQLGTRVVQVLPKMYRTGLSASDCEREATNNLLFLLSYTREIEVTETQIASLICQKAPLSEFLYWIFAHRLWDAVRREMLRGYITLEDRLNLLKGRWLVAAQFRRPDGWRRDRFDVAYDEFTEDNLPNQLFKATVLRLSRWATWIETRSHLARLRSAFADVAQVEPQPNDFVDAVQWMRRYRRRIGEGYTYRPLLRMAGMFWTGVGLQLSLGRIETFAFMFDMNQLFEEFIAKFILRELRVAWASRGWSFHAQSATRALLCDDSDIPRFWLMPDVRFEDSGDACSLIVDTKYKRLDPADANCGVSEADVYQMFAYKERYQCPRVILIYPQTSVKAARSFKANTGSPPWLEVRTVNLKMNLNTRTEQERLRSELATILFGEEVAI